MVGGKEGKEAKEGEKGEENRFDVDRFS